MIIRQAVQGDADLFFKLWTNPDIMKMVGYPNGLDISLSDIKKRLSEEPESALNRLLVAEIPQGPPIGECHMHPPDSKGIASTDIKLLPEFQGRGYGREIKWLLLDYLFRRTECRIVEATPNIRNTASIKMQEAVGGISVGTSIYQFPLKLQSKTCSVKHHIYHIHKANWKKSNIRNKNL